VYDYFYGPEGEQFSFIRVPKIFFENEAYRSMSAEAKILYGFLLDRVSVSLKNGWKDDQNRIFIICTIEEIMEKIGCGNKKAIQLLSELEDKIGLIERKRQGLGKPNLIYVKNFIRTVDNSGQRHFLKCQNDTSGSVRTTSLEMSESHGSNTNLSNTDMSNTENLIYPGTDSDGMAERRSYEDYFRRSLEYDILLQNNPYEKETLEGILDLLVDTCCSHKAYIRIAGDNKSGEVVRSRFMKLDSSHIQYVLSCLKENTTDVRNIRQYLLAALYNAPTTISAYYQAKVNYDFYGNRDKRR
jgi:hypothetical protein